MFEGLDPPRSARQGRDRRREHVVQFQPHDRPAAGDHRQPQGARSRPAVLRRRPDVSPHRAHRRLDRVRPAVPRRHPRPADDHAFPTITTSAIRICGARTASARLRQDDADGGYFYPVEYVNMVQRQQTWHLPDPVDPAPVERGITVYFTRLRVGGVDFAILEDRKFKIRPGRARSRRWGRGRTTSTIRSTIRRRSTCRACNCSASGSMKFLREWGAGLDRRGDEGRAFADGVLRRGPHARQARRPPARRPRLQRLAADAAATARWRKFAARGPCTCAATSTWPSS